MTTPILSAGCSADTTDPADVGEKTGTVQSAVGVCNYGGGQSLVVGPVTTLETATGCATYHYGSVHAGGGYYTWTTTKTQSLGCAGSNGDLLSWGSYTITGTGWGRSLPAGISEC